MASRRVPTGLRTHYVTLENPIPVTPDATIMDGDGAYDREYAPLSPPDLWVCIEPATAAKLERVTQGTAISQATHVITGPYHRQVTTQTRIHFHSRVFSVVGVANVEERGFEMQIVAVEVVA